MKKKIVLMLGCLLFLSLSACGSKNSSVQTEKDREMRQENMAEKEDTAESAAEEMVKESDSQPDVDVAQGTEQGESSQKEVLSSSENQPEKTNGTSRTEKRSGGSSSAQAKTAEKNNRTQAEEAAENKSEITLLPVPGNTPEKHPEVPQPTPEPEQPSMEAEAPKPEPPKPEAPQPEPEPEPEAGKTLIVYFSWSSNTERMANTIKEQTGGDLLELVPVTPYPADYTECTEAALKERDEDARPAIRNLPVSIKEYDKILIGYPIWWHTAPMIIGTFLEHYDLTGVDVYPFTQSASMNREQFNNSMEFVRRCANGAVVHDGLFVRYSDVSGITAYLIENGLALASNI